MKLVTYRSPSGPRVGVLRPHAERDEIVDLNEFDPSLPFSLKDLLSMEEEGLRKAKTAQAQGEPQPGKPPQLLPPIVDPQKVICVGLNYADHAAETGAKVGEEPVIFCKFPTALRGHLQPIELPAVSTSVDFEAELVVVIGREARNVSQEDAWKHVAGYCCGHDVSARDWQIGKPGRQWLLGKSFDSFAPLGPSLVTCDEIPDPGNLSIQLRLNGQTMQDSSTSQLIFPIDALIAYLSQVCTLLPGDLIFTGTPPGVGMARQPPVYLQSGDTVEIEIEKVGVLCSPVVG